MTVDEYLAALDLTPLDPKDYEHALWSHRQDPEVQQFAVLDHAYRDDGGLRATQAWYSFF